MTAAPPPRRPPANAYGAGWLLISAVAVCAAIGLGIGALAGARAPFVLLGVAAGFALGFTLVYRRYRDI